MKKNTRPLRTPSPETTYASFFENIGRNNRSGSVSRPNSTVNFIGPNEISVITKEEHSNFLKGLSEKSTRHQETSITTYLSLQSSEKKTAKANVIADGGESSLLSLTAAETTNEPVFFVLLNQLVAITNQNKTIYPDVWIIEALKPSLDAAIKKDNHKIVEEILKSLSELEDEPRHKMLILATLSEHLTNNLSLKKFTNLLKAIPSKHRATVLTTVTTEPMPSIPIAALINESINNGHEYYENMSLIINEISDDAGSLARTGAITRLKAQTSTSQANLLKIYLEFVTFEAIAKHLRSIRGAYLAEKNSTTPDADRLSEIDNIEKAVNTSYDCLFALTTPPLLIHDIIHKLLTTVKSISDNVTTQHKQGNFLARLSITQSVLSEKIIPAVVNEKIKPICDPIGIAVPDMPMPRSGRTSSLK